MRRPIADSNALSTKTMIEFKPSMPKTATELVAENTPLLTKPGQGERQLAAASSFYQRAHYHRQQHFGRLSRT